MPQRDQFYQENNKDDKDSKTVKAADDSKHLNFSINEETKEPKKKLKVKRKDRPSKRKINPNQSTLVKKKDSTIIKEPKKEEKDAQSVRQSPKDRCKFTLTINV